LPGTAVVEQAGGVQLGQRLLGNGKVERLVDVVAKVGVDLRRGAAAVAEEEELRQARGA
jgi:hypothetical protein